MHEASLHEENMFLTLTYDEQNLPCPPSLNKRDLQLFYKRYRKAGHKVRYYACGEYGDETARPHYHACVFGHKFSDAIPWQTNANGDQLYVSETLNRLWGLGYCLIGDLTFQSAAYVARYVMKKITGKGATDHYTSVDMETGEFVEFEPEFNVMSRRPGIGRDWFDKYESDCYPSDFCLSENGQKLSVPKYYDSLLQQRDPELLEALKASRKESASGRYHDSTKRRLADREQVKKAQLGLLKRGL